MRKPPKSNLARKSYQERIQRAHNTTKQHGPTTTGEEDKK